MKEKFTKEQIEEMLNNSTEEIVEDSTDLVDEFGNSHNIDEVINQAEVDVKKKYPKVNFRWSEFEIARAKKIAKELGMPYQTYIKSLLKQGMDNDEKRLKQM
jgi:predicted DNA binding CopG/RHH family protein